MQGERPDRFALGSTVRHILAYKVISEAAGFGDNLVLHGR